MLENETITQETEVATEDTTPEVITEEVAEEVAETEETAEVVEETTEEATEEVTEPEVVEVPVFDPTAEDFETKVTETLEKYELSPDLQAVIEAYKAKAEAPRDVISEWQDYGDKEQLTEMLDRQTYLTTQREEGGVIRPNTDKFVESLSESTQDSLYYDLARTPSLKYKGLSKVEEALAESLSVPGDTVGSVLKRVKDTMEMVRSNSIVPPSDVPVFIPPHLVLAFKSLSKDSRDEYELLDPSNDLEYTSTPSARARKLEELTQIQKGIDADLREQREAIESVQRREQSFVQDVENVQLTFIKEFRETFTQNLIKTVVFSDDPKRQSFEARKQVTLLRNAFLEDDDGEYARTALADAGIAFDYPEARKLVKAIDSAARDIVKAKNEVDSQGRLLNPVAFNKAKSRFAEVGREWQKLAQNILEQQTKVTTEGKADDVKKEVAKIKIAPKARGSVKASPSALGKQEASRPPVGSPEYYSWYAKNRRLEEEARKVTAYQ